MFKKTYREDPTYFKELIGRINAEGDFAGYLYSLGYKGLKTSTGSSELTNGTDRIVLNLKRDPITYFNRNDSEDKGQFFKFISKRSGNFYKAVEQGLSIIGRSYAIPTESTMARPKKSSGSLEDNYNIVALAEDKYLVESRGIGRRTLNSLQFNSRIYNAVHKREDLGRIFNIAVPKYDGNGTIRNYTIYNRPYKNRKEQRIEKFRLFLNAEYRYLFVSNPEVPFHKIVFCENAIDAMSHYEVNQGKDNFYVGLSGELDVLKLEEARNWIKKMDPSGIKKVAFAFDNDVSGFRFDAKMLADMISERSGPDLLKVHWKRPDLTLEIGMDGERLQGSGLMGSLSEFERRTSENSTLVDFKDRTTLSINMEKCTDESFGLAWKEFIADFGTRLTGRTIGVERPLYAKDWNQVLMYKKGRPIILATSDVSKKDPTMDIYAIVKSGVLPEYYKERIKVLGMQGDKLLCDSGNRAGMLIDQKDIKGLMGLKKKRALVNQGP